MKFVPSGNPILSRPRRVADGDGACGGVLSRDHAIPTGRSVREDFASPPSRRVHRGEYRRGTRKGEYGIVHSVFLRIAQGSTKELETHLLLAERVGLLPEVELAPLMNRCSEIGRMLRSLIRALQDKGRWR